MKRYITALFIVISIPMSSFANNSMAKSTGISDGYLLALLITFIVLLLIIIKALAKSIEGISKSPQFKKENKSSSVAKAVGVLVLLGSTFSAQAAEVTSTGSAFMMSDGLFWTLIGFIIFLAVVIWILFSSLMTLIKLEREEEFEEEEQADIFKVLSLTDNVPIEEESSVMMDHEYDGIRELDNNLPPWWKYMFYGTIVFAFVYMFRYHITGNGQLQGEEYAMEMQAAEEAKSEMMANATESVTEDNVVFLADEVAIKKGAAIYQGNCATCHGQLGEGGAGPNLTDEYWLHGGGINNVFKSIKYGIPAKGMIAWQSQFSPTQIQKVASYIITLKGTNPPNGRDPQGEIYIEEAEEETTEADTTNVAAL